MPEDARARGVCLVRVGRRRWMANALVQARPNCWRKWILGVGAVCVGVGLSRVLQGTDASLCNISCALILLTVEWVMSKHSRNDCCNIILRLQDDGSTTGLDLDDGGSRGREPISLVFDGVYE